MTIPRWRLAAATGALVILGVVGGGLIGAEAMPAAPGADAGATAAGVPDDALLLDSLALIGDPTSSGAAIPAQFVALRERLEGRLANVRGRLVHGTLTVLDRDGKLVTYQLDHGTVTAVGSASLTIAEAGGSSVTLSTSTSTRVRKGAKPSTLAALEASDEVVVRSTVDGGSPTATVIVVPPARPSVAAPSSGG